nr:MAG TPA: hypothetical protein [Caudoviricetes sp.]
MTKSEIQELVSTHGLECSSMGQDMLSKLSNTSIRVGSESCVFLNKKIFSKYMNQYTPEDGLPLAKQGEAFYVLKDGIVSFAESGVLTPVSSEDNFWKDVVEAKEDFIDSVYTKFGYSRTNRHDPFGENAFLIEDFKYITAGEGVIKDMAIGMAKAGGQAAYRGAKGTAKFAANQIDKNLLTGQTGQKIKHELQKLTELFKKIFAAVKRMVGNLIQQLNGVEPRMKRLVGDINNAISGRRQKNGNLPNKKMKIVTEETLTRIGLIVDPNNRDGSRIVTIYNYLQQAKEKSILEELDFSNDENVQKSLNTLVGRLNQMTSGKEGNNSNPQGDYSSIQPEQLQEMLINALSVYNDTNDQSNNTRKGPMQKLHVWSKKDFETKEWENNTFNVVPQQVFQTLQPVLNTLKDYMGDFQELQVIDYMRKEQQLVDQLDKQMMKLIKDQAKIKEDEMKRDQSYQQKQAQQNNQQNQNNNNQPTNNNQSQNIQNTQNNTDNNNNQSNNEQSSGQSFVDDKLLKALNDFSLKTYGEGILNNNNNDSKDDQQTNDNQNQEVMTHEQKLVQTLMVTYSQILNDTIGNLTKIYTDFLNIGKKCLVDYYAVTEG